MPLSAGAKLGPYEILSLIGAGGMGEVYKARDTRLERTVAIKVSAQEFGERFQREAQAIASLNHPNICTLHDVGPDYLVMEFIEGPEVKGPLPVAEALRVAIQIAEAVNHAHRHGVIHRDLKPGNILVTKSGVKVLDFGLAKLNRKPAVPSPADATVAASLTIPGTILGTPKYMAPEQLEGSEADQRSDIFAFGLVLYEMLAGCSAFEGKTHANLIAAVLAAEPKPITSFQPLIPPALAHLVETCLAKDPDLRRQSMHDVLLELRWIAAGGSQLGIPKPVVEHRKRRERLSWGVAALASAAALTLGFLYFRQTPAPVYAVRFEHASPQIAIYSSGDMPVMAPDGRSFVYENHSLGASSMLWVRRMDEVRPTALTGTDGGTRPFWSPDAKFIAFVGTDRKLKKIDAIGGTPQTLCDVPVRFAGGTWSKEGIILIGDGDGVIQQVGASGGEPKPLLKLDTTRQESRQVAPHFLPDGRHFLFTSFTAGSSGEGRGGIYLASLDSQETRRLLNTESNANFVAPDLLLFGRGRALMAQTFDPGKLQLTGEPFPVADMIARSEVTNMSFFSSSPNGALVYRPDSLDGGLIQPAWYSRDGKMLRTAGEPRAYRQGTLSPDEKRFAAQIVDSASRNGDLWLLDLTSGILSRMTSDRANKDTVAWSPDGKEVFFSSNKTGVLNLYRKLAGGGDEQLVAASTEPVYPAEWLKDGSFTFMNTNGRSFYRLAPGVGMKPETLLKTDYNKDGLRVSPDGRWAAYNTNESGRHEVYIAAFPSFTERRQVSNAGGVQGYWRKDGKELFYLSLDGKMVSVPVQPGTTLEAGIPKALFPTRIRVAPVTDQFAVSGDGQRFLLLESVESESKPFTIVLNWPAAVKRR
ncbi:MAG: protein kinase [Bryobacteraceae bacterium]